MESALSARALSTAFGNKKTKNLPLSFRFLLEKRKLGKENQ